MALSLTSLVPTSHADIGNPALSQDPNLRRVVVITCLLSLLGSMLIISIYCCCRSLRTRSKLLLVQLSVMTTGLATANLIGVLVNFDQYYYTGRYTNGTPEQRVPNVAIRMACDLESFFAVYFTSGSIMWTIGLAVFLYLRIVHYKTSASTYAQWVMTVWCYTLPMVLSLWKILSMRLGYSRSPFATEGWCGEKMTGLQTQGGDTYFITAFIGYDLWMYLAFILVPTLCVSIQLYIKQEVQRASRYVTPLRLYTALHNLDYQFYWIPLIFLVLRVWSCINTAFDIYLGVQVNPTIHLILIYLAVIGDSGQGIVNAVLFVILTKSIRGKLFCCLKKKPSEERFPLFNGNVQSSLLVENTTPLMHTDSVSHSAIYNSTTAYIS